MAAPGKAEEAAEERVNWHWRNTMRPVRFFNLDARAGLPFIVLVFYARPVTIGITAITVFIFRFLEKKGLTFPAAMRALRVWFLGPNRPGLASFRRRYMRDYG